MPIITLSEIFYLAILTVAVAYIFTGLVPLPQKKIGLALSYKKRFDWREFKFAAIVAAPAIILHELGHKFVAMGFGLNAEFFIWPTGLIIGVVLKAISSPFILIAPGYVSIAQGATTLQSVLIAFAGPAVNLILWVLCGYLVRILTLPRIYAIGLFLMKEINKLLFIFNMLPIPPLDGSKVLFGLFKLLGIF